MSAAYQFSAVECKRLVHAFRLAKGRLHPRGHESPKKFICCALDSLSSQGKIERRISDLAQKKVIKPRLEGKFTLESWLVERGVRPWECANPRKLMHIHRQQWLDMLIAEFTELAKVAR